MNNIKSESDELVLEERVFSSEVRMFSSASLNLNTLMRYIGSPIDLQLRFLCMAVQRYSEQNKDDQGKMKSLESYFVSEISRILIYAKDLLKTEKKPVPVTLKLSRYGADVTKLGNLLNLQFKKAEKYQLKSGYIPKQVQIEINDLFTKFIKIFKERFISNPDPETITHSSNVKTKKIKIALNVENIDLPDHFSKVDDIMDNNQVGIYQVLDRTTNLGFYEIEFLDNVDDKTINKIKLEIQKIK